MYYLLNQTNQIIAADEPLLALCGVSHIDELTSKIILGDTTFDFTSEEQLIINNDQSYTISKTSLSSMLGDLTLVTLGVAETIESTSAPELVPEDNFLDDFSIKEPIEEPKEAEKEETTAIDFDSDFILLKPEEQKTDDFLLEKEEPSLSDEQGEILIDIETISQSMGVSHEDYNAFLNEYIDTALGLESDLQSDTDETRKNAISTLSQLGDVLHLPNINDIINKLSSASKPAQKEFITSFYNTLSRLTTQSSQEEEIQFDLLDMSSDKPEVEELENITPTNQNSFGSISLDGIKPIHFDFQLEEAANDLSLPVELIEEFVNDFIDQAHIETKKMLEAYEEGNLDAIQKIGHLLKGASSNLRINALSDTLYQIQFCEDPNNLEAFIKEYWGHFLSFEIQIHALAK